MREPQSEAARALTMLRERRRLVAVGAAAALLAALLAVYRPQLLPPQLEKRTNVFATASTQILVDTPDSAFVDLGNEIEPLEARASVFARFLTSPTAIDRIAARTGLPPEAIEAEGPYEVNVPPAQHEPTAARRSTQILGEGALYRLRFESTPELPIVSVFAQAPRAGEAIALAAAVPAALRGYIERIQAEQGTPPERRIEIRALGPAAGGVVNEGADLQIAALVFLVVLGVWCMLVLPGRTIASGRRGGREPPAGVPGNGRAGDAGGLLIGGRGGRTR